MPELLSPIKSLLSAAINYVLPYRCSACSQLTDQQAGVCATCFQKLDFITSPYCTICGAPFEFMLEEGAICAKCIAHPSECNITRSLFKFDQHSKNLIHAFKYNDKTAHAKFFAKLLVARYEKDLDNIDMVLPVPMHRLKRVFRNYNSAQILAQEIVQIIKKPISMEILIKTKWTKSQTGLSRDERNLNIVGSIKLSKNHNLQGKNILLIDDVKTTGATSNECSRLLKSAGAASVTLLTISATL